MVRPATAIILSIVLVTIQSVEKFACSKLLAPLDQINCRELELDDDDDDDNDDDDVAMLIWTTCHSLEESSSATDLSYLKGS